MKVARCRARTLARVKTATLPGASRLPLLAGEPDSGSTPPQLPRELIGRNLKWFELVDWLRHLSIRLDVAMNVSYAESSSQTAKSAHRRRSTLVRVVSLREVPSTLPKTQPDVVGSSQRSAARLTRREKLRRRGNSATWKEAIRPQ